METSQRNAVIILAAGKGSRMKSDVHKQYMLLNGNPLLYYTIRQFENFSKIDDIILVTGETETEYVRREIVERYRFTKIRNIVPGGKERYHSVYCGLKVLDHCGYVMIHDGARPFTDEKMLIRLLDSVQSYRACAAAVLTKDTVKISDENGLVCATPDRNMVWQVQTPQVFEYKLVFDAYCRMMEQGKTAGITDDAMVVERMTDVKIKLVEGSYRNIKITTPEDLILAEVFLKHQDE